MPDIPPTRPDTEPLRTALARLFTDGPEITAMLDDIGFPVESRPSVAGSPDLVWRAIFRELEKGLLEDGYRLLLQVALGRYPHNDVLVGLAHPYPPAPSPTGDGPVPLSDDVSRPPTSLPTSPRDLRPAGPRPSPVPAPRPTPQNGSGDAAGDRLVEIRILADQAIVECQQDGLRRTVAWRRSRTTVERAVRDVQESLEALRQKHSGSFDAITPEQLRAGLDEIGPRSDPFTHKVVAPTAAADEQRAAIAGSPELRVLAHAGHQLYRALFPADEGAWSVLDELNAGDRLHLTWQTDADPWVPHLPLPLLYRQQPPPAGDPVDCDQFLGLRLRAGYYAYPATGSRPLGPWPRTTRATLLYWGDAAGDAVGEQSRRHREELRRWEPWTPAPGGPAGRETLTRFLDRPGPVPVSLLYVYCQSGSGPGAGPLLRLGSTNRPEDQLTRPDLGISPLGDRPVAFLNACGTATADPQFGNALADLFLSRGCRSYIGTEARVPAGLAARFATTALFFLFHHTWDHPTPVTDALASARRFLWDRFGNPGGLFYSHVNDEPLVTPVGSPDRPPVAGW